MRLSDNSSRLSERRSRLSASAHIDQSSSQESSPNCLSNPTNRLSLGRNSTGRRSVDRNSAGSHRRCSSTRNSDERDSDSFIPASSCMPVPEGVNLLSELEQRLAIGLSCRSIDRVALVERSEFSSHRLKHGTWGDCVLPVRDQVRMCATEASANPAPSCSKDRFSGLGVGLQSKGEVPA